MYKTEKKYWVNGKMCFGGGRYKTYSISLKNYAVMFCWSLTSFRKSGIYFYQLTSPPASDNK